MRVTRLVCSSCGSFLRGLGTDVIFVCANCGAGWLGGETGLKPLPIQQRARSGEGIPMPFWRVSAAVHVLKRTVRNEFTSTILRFNSKYDDEVLKGKTRETGGISERREFLFPAFSVNGLPGIGVSLSEKLSELPSVLEGSRKYPEVCGGSISRKDAEVLARCVAVGQETEKSDWLAEIQLVLSAVRSSIVILPCTQEVEKVHIAGTGVSFFRRSVTDWDRIIEFSAGEA